MLLTTKTLVERAMRADLVYVLQRMGVIAERPGNPFGVAIQHFGRATALAASKLPSKSFNRVVGVTPEEAPLIHQMIRWYEDRSVKPRIEVRPGALNHELAGVLTRAGFQQTAFHASLVGEILAQPRPDAVIRPVETADAMEDFLEVYMAGWGFPAAVREGAKTNMRGWLNLPRLASLCRRSRRAPSLRPPSSSCTKGSPISPTPVRIQNFAAADFTRPFSRIAKTRRRGSAPSSSVARPSSPRRATATWSAPASASCTPSPNGPLSDAKAGLARKAARGNRGRRPRKRHGRGGSTKCLPGFGLYIARPAS